MTKDDCLKNVFDLHENRMADMPFNDTLKAVLKFGDEWAKEYSKWLIDNCGGEHGKDEKGYWWAYQGISKPLNEDQIYKKFLADKQSKQITND